MGAANEAYPYRKEAIYPNPLITYFRQHLMDGFPHPMDPESFPRRTPLDRDTLKWVHDETCEAFTAVCDAVYYQIGSHAVLPEWEYEPINPNEGYGMAMPGLDIDWYDSYAPFSHIIGNILWDDDFAQVDLIYAGRVLFMYLTVLCAELDKPDAPAQEEPEYEWYES